jgi:hypothetical protein
VGPINGGIYLECVAGTLMGKKPLRKTSFEEKGEEKTGFRLAPH